MKTILIRDFKCGTKRNIFLFGTAFIFSVILCLYFYMLAQSKIQSGNVQDIPSITDYFLFVFGGMKEYIPSSSTPFQVPVLWLAIQVIVYFAVLLYPVNDLYTTGSNTMMLYGSKTKWWISKSIWTVSQVLIIYAVMFAGMLLTAYILGADTNGVSGQLALAISGVRLNEGVKNCIWLYTLTLPLLHSITGALIEINVEIFIGPVMTFAAVVAYEVLSAYFMTSVLIGNFSMLFRMQGIVDKGLIPVVGVLIQILAIIVALWVGGRYIRRKDVLPNK